MSGDILAVSHNDWLVAASFAIALMAGFTGLALTSGASNLEVPARKLRVSMAAVALGGGIWAMHFVAMLGLQLPILFYYDLLITLISALVAILIVGIALLLLHFWRRTPRTITAAGALIGAGIPVMHYIGMSGMELCAPNYSLSGILIAGAASMVLSIGAVWVAYGERTHRNILLGTLCFGTAVFAVHFIAMQGTFFTGVPDGSSNGPIVSNETLALAVAVIAFVICGAFLLSGVSFFPLAKPVSEPVLAAGEREAATPAIATREQSIPVPYELDGRTMFVDSSAVSAVRAEGHYTILYSGDRKLFCPWSISEAEKRLPLDRFVRAHRSYLINPSHVSGFERKKDNGVCFFDDTCSLDRAPVSRSRLNIVREALGLV